MAQIAEGVRLSVEGGSDAADEGVRVPSQTVLTRGVAATRCSAIRSVISVASMVNPPSDRPLTQAVLTVLRSPFSIITGRLTACGVAATTHPLTQTVLTGGVLQRGILQRGVLQRAVVYELSVAKPSGHPST